MNSFQAWLQQLDFSIVYEYAVVVAASLLCIMFHEVSHGVTAYFLGDSTAKDAGRLTFNPLKHVDLWGLLMMAIFRFGWAKPVPIDMRNFKHPIRGMAITAAAGPISNVVLAWFALIFRCIAILVYQRTSGAVASFFVSFFEDTAVISVGLAIFNVIPVPPLDGSKVLNAVLPKKAYYFVLRYEKYGFLIMMLLLFSGILNTPLTVCRSWLLTLLNNGAIAIVSAVSSLF